MLFDLDHWQEIFQSLRRNGLRTLLTACGVFWGVFMLVLMLGFGNGLERAVTGNFSSWAQNTIHLWGERTLKPHAGRQPGRRILLTTDDVEEITANIDGVEMVLPRNFVGGRFGTNRVSRKDKSEQFEVSGDLPEYLRIENLAIERGRFLNPIDMREHRKVAVIGARVRDTLFEPHEDPIGQSLQVGSVEFLVIGIHRTPASGARRSDWSDGRIFMPRSTFTRLFAAGPTVDHLAILVGPQRASSEVEAEVRTLLKARHAIHPDDSRGVGSYNLEKNYRKVRNLFLGIATLSWVVGTLTLLAGAIGVSNIMMIAVAERSREIGIRKAVGATPATLVVQVVAEAMMLTAAAGYLGLVAGVGALEIAGRVLDALPKDEGPRLFAAPELDLFKAVVAAIVLTVAGGLAGLAPARSAIAVRPVEALAHE